MININFITIIYLTLLNKQLTLSQLTQLRSLLFAMDYRPIGFSFFYHFKSPISIIHHHDFDRSNQFGFCLNISAIDPFTKNSHYMVLNLDYK